MGSPAAEKQINHRVLIILARVESALIFAKEAAESVITPRQPCAALSTHTRQHHCLAVTYVNSESVPASSQVHSIIKQSKHDTKQFKPRSSTGPTEQGECKLREGNKEPSLKTLQFNHKPDPLRAR